MNFQKMPTDGLGVRHFRKVLTLLSMLVVVLMATSKAEAQAPAAPSYFYALYTYDGLTPYAHLFWGDTSSGTATFEVEIYSGGSFVAWGTTAAGTTNFKRGLATGLPNGYAIYFRVRAKKNGLYSPYLQTGVLTEAARFNAPSNVKAYNITNPASAKESELNLSWTDNANQEDGVEIHISTNGGSFVYLGDVAYYGSSIVTIPGLYAGSSYKFKLRAFISGAQTSDPRTYTAWSPESAAVKTGVPNAPTNLAVSSVAAGGTVTLTFKDNSAGETGFDVMARPTGSGAEFVSRMVVGQNDETTSTSVVATLSGLTPGTLYDFKVRARSDIATPSTSYSADSNVVTQLMRDAVTSPRYVQPLVNQPFTYTLTTSSGSPRVSRSVAGLPAGLTFNSNSGVISGTPTATGVTRATISVTFQDGWTASTELAFRVMNPPVASNAIPAQNLLTGPAPNNVNTISLTDKFSDPEATSAVRVSTTLGNMDFVFFETQTPLTVANFENYRANNRYVNSIFHRSVPGFIIQGGAFVVATSPATGFEKATFTSTPTNTPVTNEYGLSNIRGTVAMAKVDGNPNSATNQWFVNLENNGTILDGQNGGFTAFARVAGNGMAVADAIAAKQTGDYYIKLDGNATVFNDWPLDITSAQPFMDNTKLIKMNSVTPQPIFSYAVTGNSVPGVASVSFVNTDMVVTALDSGTTNITVTATNLDGRTVSQTFPVTVISNVTTLASLVPSAGTLSPALSDGNIDYDITVPNSVTSLTLNATTRNSHATFTVNGTPATSGSPSQALNLAVGDNVFHLLVTAEDGVTTRDFTLTVKRSAIGLATTSLIVSETDGVVNIPLARLGDSTAEVKFRVTTENASAVSPSDFTALTNQEFTLPASQNSITVPVTLFANNPVGGENHEYFTARITSSAGGSELSAPETITVVILDATDTVNPVVTMTNPASNATMNLPTGTTLAVTGVATDNKGVKNVEVRLNGALLPDVVLTTSPTTPLLSTRYDVTITPVTGTNVLSVKSFDYHNHASAEVVRTFKVFRPLTVNVNSVLGSVTAGYAGTHYFEVGRSYTIVAKAIAPSTSTVGSLFTGWQISGTDVGNGGVAFTPQRIGIVESAKVKESLTFIFREGLILAPTFATNPYSNFVGTFNGLVRPSSPATERNLTSEGYFSATVQNTGAFSGKLTLDGTTLGLNGTFDHEGHARFGTARTLTQTVARTGLPSLVVSLDIDLSTPGADDKMTGTVLQKDFRSGIIAGESTIDVDRAYYNGTTQVVPNTYLTINGTSGTFTAYFPAKTPAEQPAGFTAEDFPQGSGYATLTVSKGGVVSVVGVLADGSPLTASGSFSQISNSSSNRFALFAQLYGKKGFLSGFVQIGPTTTSDMAATDLKWLRPFQSTSQYYPYGWPEVLNVDMQSAVYTAVAGQSPLKAPSGANLQSTVDADGNATLLLSLGQLEASLSKSVSVGKDDVVAKVPYNDPTFTMTLTRKTGMISGTFFHTDDSQCSYNAIIYQKGAQAGAHGFFLTKKPIVIDYSGESGKVKVTGQP